jgi:16S rRNA (cytidine1402-2'-O)-methyltransferase
MSAQTAKLYVVATPIGNLEDFSPRAIACLKSVDVILAEDTRHSSRLLQHFGIQTPMQSCHEHNERNKSTEVVDGLKQGRSFALISDAGTPVWSDPGACVVAAVLDAGFEVSPLPGPSAAVAALSISGFHGLPFHFYGFLPSQSSAKKKLLTTLQETLVGTLCFYESPHRILDTLDIFKQLWGEQHPIVLAKELTKVFETLRRAPIAEIIHWLEADPKRQQGEFVLLLDHKPSKTDETQVNISLDALLTALLQQLKLKEAVTLGVKLSGYPKNQVYERALALTEGSACKS